MYYVYVSLLNMTDEDIIWLKVALLVLEEYFAINT